MLERLVKTIGGVRSVARCEAGFTLTELMVVSTLMLVVLAGIYQIFGTGQSYYQTIEGQNIAVQGASRSMVRLSKEVREALEIESSVDGYGPVEPGSYQLALRTDYDNDDEFETVAFIVDDSLRLRQYVKEPFAPSATMEILATDVRNKASGIPLFTYYDATGTALSDPTRIPSRTYSVRIEIVADRDPARSPGPMHLVTGITRRNKPSG